MDNGNNGDFSVVYNGTLKPGVLSSKLALANGKLYRFKVSGVNYNGEGSMSSET
jgi:hypothetical protein